MIISNEWIDYEVLAAGNGEKIDRWGNVILRRPDPSALWNLDKNNIRVDALYHRSNKGGGYWDFYKKFPEFWHIKYKDLTFKISPTNFKHTGLFPEQAANWDFMSNLIKNNTDCKILNLFAYTGGATIACSKAGAAEVVHVDSSKGMIDWAKDNARLSNLENNHIRFILDDVNKFVEKEIRRGRKYQGIVLDPPSYGRGPNKEIWKLEDNLFNLLTNLIQILDDQPLFLIINTYTTGVSPIMLENIMKLVLLKKYPQGKIDVGELGLPITNNNLTLPCGIYGRFTL